MDRMDNAIVSGAPVTVYSTTTCGWCRRAEELLHRHRIPFDTVDVTRDREAREMLIERANWRTVPVIFVEGRPIGGYRELADLLSRGGLAHLVPPPAQAPRG
jgi:glutaredoxin 3